MRISQLVQQTRVRSKAKEGKTRNEQVKGFEVVGSCSAGGGQLFDVAGRNSRTSKLSPHQLLQISFLLLKEDFHYVLCGDKQLILNSNLKNIDGRYFWYRRLDKLG